ncbi:MAG: hypothetical protein E6I99_12425 [Chloroflexi bacterium]|nr:MAG: hypothetical protein E6I99_12425 [Chloroflexota bacterium]
MALEIRHGSADEYSHTCRLPWPVDPEIPEGHVCECGRRWTYQPARWEPVWTIQELQRQQQAGEFLQGIIPRFRPDPPQPAPGGVIVPMRPPEDPVIS